MEFDIETAAAFTGHRPERLGGYDVKNPIRTAVRKHLKDDVLRAYDLGFRTFITGMAQGFDLDAAVVVTWVRWALRPDIRLVAAVPFIGQARKWPASAQEMHADVLRLADEVVVVSEGEYAGWKLQKRNEWMVDRCRLLIACYDGSGIGGTANCVRYAQNHTRHIDIWTIDPDTVLLRQLAG